LKSWSQALLAILAGLLGAGVLYLVNSNPRGEPVALLPPPSPAPVVVHVEGAVHNPGLYSLAPGSRVSDAIEQAGGLLADAYEQSLNLAAPLADGDKVLVPFTPEEGELPLPDTSSASSSDKPTIVFPININTATQEELEALPGIGPAKAQEIINYREANGPFTTIEQIQNVPGIGPATFDGLKDLITVGTN
jgi:competence protein ComEA